MKSAVDEVGAGSAGSDAEVAQAEFVERVGVAVREVAGAVVAHDRLDSYSALAKPGDGTTQEGDGAVGVEPSRTSA